ncbi:hypothetical protein ES705_35373 [subsurface metagenome]
MELVKVRPLVEVEGLELDPIFEAGSSHTASAILTNPTTKEFTYTTELYLGVTKVATSGIGTATIPAGGSVTMNYPIIAPLVEAEYEVFLDVWVEAELIKHYQATENVVTVISPAIEVSPIIWV